MDATTSTDFVTCYAPSCTSRATRTHLHEPYCDAHATKTAALDALIRKGGYLGGLARDHYRIGNITADEMAKLTGRIAAICDDFRDDRIDYTDAYRALDRVAGEINDV